MASMNLHFLDARGALTGLDGWLRRCLTDTHEKAAGLMGSFAGGGGILR